MNDGDLIYYTGDMANQSGWFRVVRTNQATKYSGLAYDLEEANGHGRQLSRVMPASIGTVYHGHCNPRFVTEDAYHEYRQLAALNA